MYTAPMRKHALATLTIAFTALLLTQSLGLHLHVQGMDQPGGAHVAHIQHHDHDHGHGHDHQNEVDGSKLELGNVWSKILPLILPSLLLAIPCTPRTAIRLFSARPSRPDRPPLRWRPPLRAPPILA